MQSKTMAKAVATVTVFSIITRTLSFIFKIYLSHTAGAEVMGLYQICLSMFFMFSAFSASGLTTVLSRKTAEARALDKNEKGYGLLSSVLLLGVSVAALTVVSLLLLKPYLSNILSDNRAAPLFVIMLPALVSTCIYSTIRSWFWGSKQFTYFSITEMVEEILRILFTLLFVSGMITGLSGAYGIAWAFTVSDITVAVVLIIIYFAKGGRLAKPEKLSEIAKPAVPLTAMRLFGSLIGTFLAIMLPARLIVGGMSIAEATASYGRIAGMAGPLLFAPNAIISSLVIVLIPEMSENGIKKDTGKLSKHINGGIAFSVIISGLFLVFYSSLGKELTGILFNDTESGEYLEAAAWMLLLMPIHQITASALNSIGKEKESFVSYLISTVFMVASVYFLTPVIGLKAVVAGNVVTLAICSFGNIHFLRKKANYRIGFLKPLVLTALFVIPCSFFANTVNSLLSPYSAILSLIAALILSGSMYAVLAIIFGLVDVRGFKLRRYVSGETQGLSQ